MKLTEEELNELVFWNPETIEVEGEVVNVEETCYNSLIEKLLMEGSVSVDINGRYKELTHWNGVEFEIVADNSIYHDGGDTEFIVRFGDIYVMFRGYYSSWDSDDRLEEYYQVLPEKKMVEVTEWHKV